MWVERPKDPNVFQPMAVWSRSGGKCELPHCTRKMRHIFAFRLADGRPITPTTSRPALDATLEDLNAAAGINCDPTTCASLGENEPFNLRYVVDTIFDNLGVQ